MILLTVLSLNVFGDCLRDALDPKSKVRLGRGPRRQLRARGERGLMARFAVRRLLGMVVVLFAVSVIVFLIFNVIPNSDPAARIAGEKAPANEQLIANIKRNGASTNRCRSSTLTMMKQVFTGDLISYQSQHQRRRRNRRRDPRDPLALHRRRRDLDVVRRSSSATSRRSGRAGSPTGC